ncbi:unnamed protein product [Mycena citricolor]|uniref:ThuA-like domain-containing protein n=1 Tax=Mycena citricolor TaxID=2018698 RepID=A0AAD2Q2H3_9AGAR|nr:unnamed protein product [Mycena citricolor]CAK5269207.1 unnamed protein product [Mycena citricolor]
MRIALLKPLLSLIFWVTTTTSTSTPARVLIYTATKGFRHDSIPTAVQALKNQSQSLNIVFDATEDAGQFTDQNLAVYDAIVFISTTGEVLDDGGKGVHASSDCLNTSTFYGNETGAYFDYHPFLQNASVDVLEASHPSVNMLPAQWHIQEEMYNFKSDPRSVGAVVVLAANESSYIDTGVRRFDQGSPHPSAWYQERGAGVQSGHSAGRSFYTSLGHLNETWKDSLFIAHVTGGLLWTLFSNTTKAFNSSALVGNPQATSTSSTKSIPSASATQSPVGNGHSSSVRLAPSLALPLLLFGVVIAALSSH